jgi:hypothetical protein
MLVLSCTGGDNIARGKLLRRKTEKNAGGYFVRKTGSCELLTGDAWGMK